MATNPFTEVCTCVQIKKDAMATKPLKNHPAIREKPTTPEHAVILSSLRFRFAGTLIRDHVCGINPDVHSNNSKC
jgi:hypothetical protein